MSRIAPLACIRIVLAESKWLICARDAGAVRVVTKLGDVMSLTHVNHMTERREAPRRVLHVFTGQERHRPAAVLHEAEPDVCILPSPDDNNLLVLGMCQIAMTIVRAEQAQGSLLIHGALAATPDHMGGGIILAGPGTVGKTTASNRLPHPWRSLCDDSSLVARDAHGQYRAHPWPTWSNFYDIPNRKAAPDGRWDVQNSVPLRAIFFLAQADEENITPLPFTPAVAYLMQIVQQVSWPITKDMPPDQTRIFHEQQLAAAEALIKTIPAYTLHLSLTGAFWEKIEETMASDSITQPSQPEFKQTQWIVPAGKKSKTSAFLFDDDMLAVNYFGTSMKPSLRHSDLLQVIPYADKPIRKGDVVYFKPPTGEFEVVHRVVRVTSNGISTRGDNNPAHDPYLLQPEHIIGRVTAAWHNDKRRKIAGGFRGIYLSYNARIFRRLNRFFTTLLHGTYRRLAAGGFFRYLLPASLQPRVFEFKQRYLSSVLKLIIKNRVIGYYDAGKKIWVIDRPWKLVIDETKLPMVTEILSPEPPNLSKQAQALETSN